MPARPSQAAPGIVPQEPRAPRVVTASFKKFVKLEHWIPFPHISRYVPQAIFPRVLHFFPTVTCPLNQCPIGKVAVQHSKGRRMSGEGRFARKVLPRIGITVTDLLAIWAQTGLAAEPHNPAGIWRHFHRTSCCKELGKCRTCFSALGNFTHSSMRSKSPSSLKTARLLFLDRPFVPEMERPFFANAISVKEGFG